VEETGFRTKVLRGLYWLTVGTFAGQLISWVSTLIVIRLLLPKDYGLMAMAGTALALLTTFSELGIGASIVQAENPAEEEIRQIYGFVLLTSAAGWLICHLAAPLAAAFYREPDLVPVLRVMNINLILIALYMVPQAIFIREMDFKAKTAIDLSAQIGSASASLLCALAGMGVWALVAGSLTLNAIKAVAFNRARSKRYRPLFRFAGSGKFLSYGAALTGSRLFYSLYHLSDTVVVGRFLGNASLGIYAVAMNLASLPAEKVLPLITQISFASYARIQNDRERIRRNLLRTTGFIAFSGFPVFWGMAAVAPEAIPLILGPKWTSVVVPFQLLCLMLPLKALGPVLASTVNAIGKANVNLVNTALTGALMTAAFLAGVREGITGVCLAWVIAYPVAFLFTCAHNLKVLGFSKKQYAETIAFPVLAAAAMAMIVLAARRIVPLPPLNSLVVLTAVGMISYAGMTLLFRRNDYREMKKMVQRQ
jgi:O-antigen/teichoic acid export membrane protein